MVEADEKQRSSQPANSGRARDATADHAAGTGEAEVLSASMEDYLEAILRLERASRVTRVSEIADQLNVSRPSVTGALKNLAARGLVRHERYGHVTLTPEGEGIAVEVERRHVALRDFLTGVLDVPEEEAEVAACRLEHVLEPEIIERFVLFTGALEAAESKEHTDGEQT